MNDSSPEEMPVVRPTWPAPEHVLAFTTTRAGGTSRPPYDTFNLADHVGDDAASVEAHRETLVRRLGVPSRPVWLSQVHGATVVRADEVTPGVEADAAVTSRPRVVCAVLTADCLPVLLSDDEGTVVAAAHAGWRGLGAGILESTVLRLAVEPSRLHAWLGPGIGPDSFEVGDEVRRCFTEADPSAAAHFRRNDRGRWWADLPALATRRLEVCGVRSIHASGLCTFADRDRFFSYRRDGACGRMATLIWIERSN